MFSRIWRDHHAKSKGNGYEQDLSSVSVTALVYIHEACSIIARLVSHDGKASHVFSYAPYDRSEHVYLRFVIADDRDV